MGHTYTLKKPIIRELANLTKWDTQEYSTATYSIRTNDTYYITKKKLKSIHEIRDMKTLNFGDMFLIQVDDVSAEAYLPSEHSLTELGPYRGEVKKFEIHP